MNQAPNETAKSPSWHLFVRWIVRFGIHLFVLYQLVGISTEYLPGWILALIKRHAASGDSLRLLFEHLFVFGAAPAFVVGVLSSAKLRHRAALYIWVVPVTVFAVHFVFGPGMYVTMLWDSNFSESFRYFFGALQVGNYGEFLSPKDAHGAMEYLRACAQLKATVPAYAGIAYSVGAYVGMSTKASKLQRFMARV